MTTHLSVKVIKGDIFKFNEGVFIIPCSTTGTLNNSFEKGLVNFGIEYTPASSALGSIEAAWDASKSFPNVHLVFATSVHNNASDYTAIATLASTISSYLEERDIKNVYCPLLGTGSGNLDPFFSFVYLVLPFLTKQNAYNFNVVIYDAVVFEKLSKLSLDRYELVKTSIQEVFKLIRKDTSITDVINSKEYFFDLAQKRVIELRTFSLNDDSKKDILTDFNKFQGNFQEFINSQSDSVVIKYLNLIGEIISYLDTKAYNRHEWNKYPDKRAIARAGVRQNDWVKNLIIFSIEREAVKLPNNIKNAINYVLRPLHELPILSERDKSNVLATLGNFEFNERPFNQILRHYFEGIQGGRPVNEANWGVIIIRIIYSPLVKLLWDPDSKKPKVKRSESKENSAVIDPIEPDKFVKHIDSSGNIRPKLSFTNSTEKTYKARLHDDRHAEVDLLNYELYAQTIVNFLKHEDTQAPVTIGIYAPWGMGKTTLMKFIQRKLNEVVPKSPISSEIKETIRTRLTSAINKIIGWFNEKLKRNFKKIELKEKITLTVKDVIEELKKPPFSRAHIKNYQYPAVWFNAWKYDNTEQILSGLAYEIINQLVEKLPNQLEKERFYFNLNRKRYSEQKLYDDIRSRLYGAFFNWISIIFIVGGGVVAVLLWYLLTSPWWVLSCGGGLISAFITSLTKLTNEKSKAASTYLSKFITQPKYEEKLGYFHQVEDDLKKVFDCLVDKDNPSVIFIDDLDRCSSKKVVEVIEAINLFINGDFPHCYFIIGMDAQMVAASIEACYTDVDKKLSGLQRTSGSLGWHFMEKFVQLQFVIPNLSNDSGRMFLKKLLEDDTEMKNSSEKTINDLKERVQSLDLTDKQSINELSDKLDNISSIHKEEVNKIKSVLIDRAARELDDSEKNVAALLENYAHYLNVSPRMIKRFANLFRFYRFMQIPNLTSKLNELEEDEIAQMVIISLRWPQLPRVIQWNTASDLIVGNNALERASFLDTQLIDGWKDVVPKESFSWLLDESLETFLSKNKIKLRRYVEVGVW